MKLLYILFALLLSSNSYAANADIGMQCQNLVNKFFAIQGTTELNFEGKSETSKCNFSITSDMHADNPSLANIIFAIDVFRNQNSADHVSNGIDSDSNTLYKQRFEKCQVANGVLEVKLTSKENYSWRRTYTQYIKVVKDTASNKITFAHLKRKVSGGGFFGSSSKTKKEDCYID